jgi:ABC-type polysaccharide/polyol phosphate export permease
MLAEQGISPEHPGVSSLSLSLSLFFFLSETESSSVSQDHWLASNLQFSCFHLPSAEIVGVLITFLIAVTHYLTEQFWLIVLEVSVHHGGAAWNHGKQGAEKEEGTGPTVIFKGIPPVT